MLGIVRTIAASLFVCAAGATRLDAQPGSPLGTAQLQVSGARLTLYADALTTDAEQTINVGEAARVRTCYGTGAACGTAASGSVPGLKVVGDLSGPELPQPIPYETAPGGTFFLPGFQREGDYLLSNVRLVETASGRVLANAEPSVATLHVRQILLASATVTRLTLADLQARGITITQQNFNAFKFAVGFLFSGTTVIIDLPVLYNGNGGAQPLAGPVVNLGGLPPAVASAVRRWQPPNIIPFQLNATGPRVPKPGGTDDEVTDPDYPLYGAIILPGSVSFLNQFFDAKLIVANGAPNGSGATLQNVTGAIRLPSGDVLRLASTAPPVAAGQKLPVLEANGQGAIGAGEQGTASWTVEGLLPGTHVLRMEIEADLARPGRPDLATGGVAQAAVEVVDARFQLAFNHPDVVRTGEPYSLYVTVTNLSRAAQNLVTVDLATENISGTHKADAQESFAKTIPTLAPGASETLEYRLVADVTGTCVATTFQATGSLSGVIRLRAGVGEAGIPLSPAALILPRFTNLLPKSLVDADVRLLGLAYSLATAPAGATPAGLPHPLKADVERRAIDLGEAGQRLYLQERLLESLEALALDQLGNRHDLPEYDGLRRALDRGAQASTALGDLFRLEQQGRNLTAADFVDHFAAATSYGRPWMAAALVPNGSQPAPTLELRQSSAAGTTYLAYTSEDPSRLRSLPYGEIYAIHDAPGGTKMPFALVGRLDAGASYRVDLHAPATGASGRLVLVVPSDDLSAFRKVDFGFLTMGASDVWEVRAVKAAGDAALTFGLVYAGSGAPVPGAPAPSVTNLSLPPFRLIGAVQDPELDRYGLGISYLFNRPPDKASAETPSSYAVRSTFHGQDSASPAVTVDRVATKAGAAAYWQPNSERVVNVRYQSPISALNGIFESQPVIRHEHLLVTNAIRDVHGTPLDPQVPAVVVDPNRTGGLVEGKVLRGDSTPAAGSRVQLLRWRKVVNPDAADAEFLVLDLVSEALTGADGGFYFDFVEEPPPPSRRIGHPPMSLIETVQSGFTLRAVVPAGADPVLQPEEKEEVSTTIRLQNRLLHVNIALLGRGTVKGRLVHADDGSPVTDGTVAAASTLFPEQRTVQPAADGSFTFGGLPVGPITLSGRDVAGNRVYQTVGIQRPGDVVNVTLQLGRTGPPKTGTVSAKVMRIRSGSPRPPPIPSPGATVAVYSNGTFIASKIADNLGNATFTGVPAGKVTLQAADFGVSRTPALTDLTLAADATVSATLTLAEAAPRSVVGRVLFHDGPSNTNLPVSGAVAFIAGPGSFAYTDAAGTYRIDGVPVQGVGDAAYTVTAFDNARGLQGQTALPPVLDTGDGTPVLAADILLRSMSGGIDGVVVDPLGRPYGGAAVELGTDLTTVARSDGRFSFDDIAVGSWPVVAHVGDGLVAGKVGFFGQATASIVFGGHRPFVTIRMAGSGVVNVRTRTSASQGVQSPITYRPTVYANASIGPLSGNPIQTTTDPDGRLTLVLPVGGFSLTAVNPLNGNRTFTRSIDYPGQVINLDVVFDSASTVTGRVVGVDGVTPVPNADVTFRAGGLLPQVQRTDGQGAFRYELVPRGAVSVTAAALVGSVDRVGRADGVITGPGQTLDLTVVMKAQGTVRGRVVDVTGGVPAPLAFAQFYVQESGFPNRRLPAGTGFFTADDQGAYAVAHVFAGGVTVVARDRNQVTRQGSARGDIAADFQVVTLPDIVMTTSVGSIGITVRDPDSGAPVADAQITLSNGDVTVADVNGQASFDALPLGTYSAHAFHAPTGRAGLTSGLRLQNAGDRVDAIVVLDTRGQVAGTLWDDAAKTAAVGGGTVQLTGRTNGRSWGTSISALASTSSDAATLGQFLFDGIPPGTYALAAGVTTSPRRAAASLATTPTAPAVSVDLVLEPVADRFVRLFESLSAGVSEVNPANGIYALTLSQSAGCPPGCVYSFTTGSPFSPYPGHLYRFPNVLTAQSLAVSAQESSGKLRTGKISGTGAFAGSGTSSDPYRLVLRAKGRVVVTVRDAVNQPAQANVTLDSAGGHYEAATDAAGVATFDAVVSGDVYAAARVVATGFSGSASGKLQFDDQTLSLGITLAPAVLAHGVVYHPPAGDVWNGDVATLTPESGAIVQIRDSGGTLQIATTGADGAYRFAGLRTGAYTITASDALVVSLASGGGSLSGPNGNDNALPPLVLDASRPVIVSIVPPPGSVGISRNAPVEITFSEPLLAEVLPSGGPTSPYFTLRATSGLSPAGAWTASTNPAGQQVVRFTPAGLYDNTTVYSLTIAGGPFGVRDRVGRSITDLGDVGSNFTTSDSVGPLVVGSVPALDRPVDPVAPIRFDFSEVVTATPQELDGSGPTPAAQLFWQQNGNPVWQPVPVTMFLSRGGYSLVVQPPTGVTYQNDSFKRHIHLSRLKDASGNAMADYDRDFRVYDLNPPHVEVAFPAGAPAGQLVGGSAYTLAPVLTSLDDLPLGDVDRVEYFLASSGDPSAPASTPAFTARTSPFGWTFVAAYVGNGVDPRPFPVWVKATDTSTNASNVVKLAMTVLPNAPPVVASVAAAATAPVAGTFYAGSALAATALGVADPDGASVTLAAELRKNNAGSPNDAADLVASLPSQALAKPGAGWGALPPPVFASAIPITTAEGTSLFFRVRATDSLGASATAESARFAVAHDPNAPILDSFVARLSGSASPSSQFFIGQKLVLEFRARDSETAVRQASIALSGVFASPLAAALVGGTTNLYRTAELTVPATVPVGGLAVTATASATDWGGNTGTSPLAFNVSPTPDPYAPVATWLTPWEGGAWPSGYTSTVSAQGAAILLRVKVSDLDRVGNADAPGTIASVQFKGPADAAGTLAAAFVDGSLVSGTGGPGAGIYEALWRVPNGVALGAQLPFQVRVVDAGANATTADAHLRAVPARKVYEAAQVAVLPADTMLGAGGDAAGPVFLLDGTTLSLYPQTAPAVRSLASMFVYAGGVAAGATFTPSPSVLTAPEVTSYASSVLYNPLELTVTDTFGLGHGSRVDVSAKGLLGSTPTQSMVLPGQTGSQQNAGGSHGGSGGPGSPLGWTRTDLYASGSVYDSVKDPALPGGGAGYATGPFGATAAGGTGGGVVRLLAPGATLHLAGDLLADGGNGPGDGGGGSLIGAGGAGGSIRVVASRLEGAGLVSAAGGRGTNANYAGGGGGGRIALSFADPPAAGLPLTVRAPGGFNSLPPDANAQQVGGAGTVYLEELDALGAPKAPGRLIVTNGSGKPAWPTPFTGAQHFASVEGRGAARLVFTDDLTVGPDPGAVNDRSTVSLDAEARLLLKADGPQAALTASPDGGDVNVNQALTLTWIASDPAGLFSITRAFSPQAPATTAYADEPLSASQGAVPLTLTVPAAQPPGPITYTVTATDRAGRVATVQKTWTVLADTTPPVVSVSGLVVGGVYHAGQTVSGTVTATDNGSIASVKVLVDGQTLTLTGPGPGYAFSYLVPANLAAARDTTLQAVATDGFGNAASTTPVALHFLLDAPPTLNLTGVTPGTTVLPGATLTATANAADDVLVTSVVFTLSGAVTTTDSRTVNLPSTAQAFSYKLPDTLTDGQTVTLSVDVNDTFGHKVSSSPVSWTVSTTVSGKISVETKGDGSGTVVPAQSIPAGSALTVYAISRDASNRFVANVAPESWSLSGITGGVVPGDLVAYAAGSFVEIPTGSPWGIAAGPDGNLWFTETDANKIGRITPTGIMTEFAIPAPGSQPRGIAAGPDGNLWFTETAGNRIGRITTSGVVTEFPIPTAGSRPSAIAAGPDGNVWFAETLANKIGRITAAGIITEFAAPSANGIVAGPDGNLWFTENGAAKIGRMTTSGVVTEFSIPTPGSRGRSIVLGPDGNLWFAEAGFDNIGRITSAGVVTEFPVPTAGADLRDIAVGPDGNLWFTGAGANLIGRITPAGVVTEFPIPTAGSGAFGIAAGSDGNLWFTEYYGASIGRLATGGSATFTGHLAGSGAIHATKAGLTSTDSGVLTVVAGAAAKLGFGTPPSSATAGFPITPAVTVRILDAGGNPTTGTASITVAIGTNPSGGTLSGTLTVAAVAGVATFSDLTIDKAGTGYTLTVSSAGLTGAVSPSFSITAAAPAKLAFGTQPYSGPMGSVITPSVAVTILDAFGNQTAGTSQVTVAIGTNPSGGTLSGTLTVAAVAGVATFSDLSIDRFGKGYTLTAASAGLIGATSALFNVTAGAATKILVETAGDGSGAVVSAQSIPAGSSLTVYAISRDASNNFVANVVPDTWSLAGLTGGVVAGDLVANAAGTFTEFTIPTASSQPNPIAAGPDGNMWFTETNKIGRITTAGIVTEFAIPTASTFPRGMAAGPDGNLWFTELNGNKIGRITTAGGVTEFAIPTAGSQPWGIVAGPDGNLWFTEISGNKIGRITTAGVVTEFSIPTAGANPRVIAAGPDGNLWFTEISGNKIGRITTAGVVTEFTIPTAGSQPQGIAAGPDGNLWFTEIVGNKIGRITTAGTITEFTVPTASSQPAGIAAGPDGGLWFIESSGNKIGRITTAGTITEFTIPTAGSQPAGIAAGPDGNLWFTESNGNKIGRIATGGSATFTGHLAGSGAVHAARAGLTSTDSGVLTVVAGAAAKLGFGTPPSSATAGSPITPAVTVRILDAGGNPTTGTASVTVAIGTNPSGGTLSGTLTVAAAAGVATFSDLTIDKAGTGYTLTVSSAGLTGAVSPSFSITAAAPAKLAFGTQPSSTSIASSISPAVTVNLLDAGGNQTTGTAAVTVAIGTNPAGGTLSGTLTVAAVAGVATFGNLSIDKFGTGYTLTAAGAGLTGATSSTFNITAGSPTKIRVETAPDGSGTVVPAQSITTGSSMTVYAISRDASNNFVGGIVPDAWTLTGITGGIVAGDLVANAAGSLSEFAVPTAGSNPVGIAAGPDGNLWFTESAGNKIGRMTTAGVVTEFSLGAAIGPNGIVAGPDGNLWFAESSANKIGRITPAGVVTEFPLGAAIGPNGIVAGPDGNLWFTESSANRIGRITTAGVVTEFAIPTAGSGPLGIAAGPDGNLWFTEFNGGKIGRITTAGVVTEFSIPTASAFPYGIATGPDGKLWFAENGVNKIGRITIAGVVTEFPIPTANSRPERVAVGPDGNLWFTENSANKIGRMTTAGVVTEFAIPTSSSSPRGIAAGPDGNLWFTEYFGFKIGRIATGASATFTGHLVGSAAIHAAKAGLTSTDSGVLTVGSSVLSATPAVRSLSLCADFAAPLKPGSSFVACADTGAQDVSLEISGALEARVPGYGNCRDPIAIPGAARPGPLKIVATARDAEGRTVSAAAHALVVADERAPVLVAVEPAPGAVFRSGDPLRVAVAAWDDVGIASVAITLGETRTFLTAPPFEVVALAPPVAAGGSLPVLVEVFDPSGNVSRRALDLGVLPAGARLPLAGPVAPEPGVSFEDGRLSVDGGWPWRDADGETRGRTLELPAIGTHAVLAVDGAVVALDGPVARAAVHGGAVDVRRGGEVVGRFRILSVSEDGTVLRLEGGAARDVRRGDFLEGVWSFGELMLARGARLVSGDVVEARTVRVDASSVFLSKNLQIPSSAPAPAECPSRGPRPEPPGAAPAAAPGAAP